MPRKTSLTPPLLYVVQPELQGSQSKAMQTRYRAKISKAEEETMTQTSDTEQESASMLNGAKDPGGKITDGTESMEVKKTEIAIENHEEKSGDKKEQMNKELMQFFLQRLNPRAQENDKETTSRKNRIQTTNEREEVRVQSSNEASEEKVSTSANHEEVRRLVSRLSRYPDFVRKPLCEAIVRGEKVRMQVDKKRGDQVRVIINSKKKTIDIYDISELIVL